jgi:hypothetical protein
MCKGLEGIYLCYILIFFCLVQIIIYDNGDSIFLCIYKQGEMKSITLIVEMSSFRVINRATM